MFSRWKQRLAERMNRVPVSEYAPEFQAGLNVFENTAAGSKRMIASVRKYGASTWVAVAPASASGTESVRTVRRSVSTAGGRFFPVQGIAQAGEDLAGVASSHTHYATHMLKLSRTQRSLSMQQESLEMELEADVITAYQDFLAADLILFKAQKKNMELRRLDMDRALHASRGKKAHHPKVFLAEAKRQMHMKAMEDIQATVDRLHTVYESHQRAIAAFLIALRTFHARNIQILTSTLFELGQDFPFPPPSPLTSLPPRKSRTNSNSVYLCS